MAASPTAGVPLCDIQAQFRELRPQFDAALARVLESGQVILGPEVAALENEVARYCGVAYGVGCGSGTDALSLALHALEIGPGDEVILPTFTFFATAGAVCRAGARPVFVDIDPITYNLDPFQVENKITPRTRAMLPVHLFGQCADMEPLWNMAERHDLIVIEDAAQSLGSEYQGKRAGSLGGIGCLSFYPTKNLGGFGDGGMVVTGDPDWAARMACLRMHGMEPKYHHKYIGWNARLDAVQAALLRVKLPHLDRAIGARQAAARRYDGLIEEHHLGHFLRGRRFGRIAGTRSISTWCAWPTASATPWCGAQGRAHRLRDLLSGAAALAGMPGRPRPSAGRLPRQRGGVPLRAGPADVPGDHRRSAAARHRQLRRLLRKRSRLAA